MKLMCEIHTVSVVGWVSLQVWYIFWHGSSLYCSLSTFWLVSWGLSGHRVSASWTILATWCVVVLCSKSKHCMYILPCYSENGKTTNNFFNHIYPLYLMNLLIWKNLYHKGVTLVSNTCVHSLGYSHHWIINIHHR